MKTIKKIFLFIIVSMMMNVSFSQNVRLSPRKDGSGLWGYFDWNSEKWVIKPKYTKAGEFCEGMSLIRDKKMRFGYINENGKVVIKPKYGNADDFRNGVAFVADHYEEVGFIDNRGKMILSLGKDSFDFESKYKDPKTKRGIDPAVDITYARYFNDTVMLTYMPYYDDGYFLRVLVMDKNGEVLYYLDKSGRIDPSGRRIDVLEKPRIELSNIPSSTKKPQLATIEWSKVPSTIEKKLFMVRAKIKSESKFEYFRILRNDTLAVEAKLNVTPYGDRNPKGGLTPGGTYNEKSGTFEYAINESIELLDGKNTIVIEVKNEADGISRKEQIIFINILKSDLHW